MSRAIALTGLAGRNSGMPKSSVDQVRTCVGTRFGGPESWPPNRSHDADIGVAFDVLSYAGVLCVTLVADPKIVPDLAPLTSALSAVWTHLANF